MKYNDYLLSLVGFGNLINFNLFLKNDYESLTEL